MKINIRPATPGDAEAIIQLGLEFDDYLRSIGDNNPTSFDAATYLKDGFGEDPAFSGLAAETNGEVIGYLLYHPGYNIDRGGRVLHVIDLFVTDKARSKGIGQALMEEAAEICRKAGGAELVWEVFLKNKLAMSFYEKLGAKYLQQKDMKNMYWKIEEK
ncbi:GNAT family N-acetyltransferase [Chloroflexota bacterium]